MEREELVDADQDAHAAGQLLVAAENGHGGQEPDVEGDADRDGVGRTDTLGGVFVRVFAVVERVNRGRALQCGQQEDGDNGAAGDDDEHQNLGNLVVRAQTHARLRRDSQEETNVGQHKTRKVAVLGIRKVLERGGRVALHTHAPQIHLQTNHHRKKYL